MTPVLMTSVCCEIRNCMKDELNPDEFVWNDLKNNVVGWKTVSSKKGLKSIIVGGLRSIQKRPEKVRPSFQAKHTKYAA